MSDITRSSASIPPTPVNEAQRLESLDRLAIVDTEPERPFDDIVELARQVTGAPIAFITFIEEARQWFKATSGYAVCETPRRHSFCAHALGSLDPLIVEDAHLDERFADNPAVVDDPHLRFYAGFPLAVEADLVLGTLCVLDNEPRTLSQREHEAMDALRRQVQDQLRLRLELRESERLRREANERARELERARRKLIQAQKMKALGRMAGGVAHDFNNILTVISTCGKFLSDDLPSGSQSHEDAVEIVESTRRASALTRQLLAFSRSQVLEPRVLGLNDAVQPMEKMLRRILEENITFETNIGGDNVPLYADPGQLEQVVLNLVLNARDAVEPGGRIALETERRVLDASAHEQIPAGEYAVICVRDDGVGIASDMLDDIFEPFVSAKDEGTGLGLATVQGVVSQSRGYISVDSELGEGSTFSVWFPVAERPPTSLEEPSVEPKRRDYHHLLLVVEDDRLVRKSVVRILEAADYRVLAAKDPSEGLSLWDEHRSRIDAIVSDVVMPVMRGPEFVERVRQERADIPVLYMTGYADTEDINLSDATPTAVLHKPTEPAELTKRLAELLGISDDAD